MATLTSVPVTALRSAMLLLSLLATFATALQVTPNSPCASLCQDSTTVGKDIVCADGDFSSKANGQTYTKCMTCLQSSGFVNGDENDQQWFLYNMRYSLDYCVFGYNASNSGTSPCTTSEACGPLKGALMNGIGSTENENQYGYCEADGQVMSGDLYENCISCVNSDTTHAYLSNFLVALVAGCQQQPNPGSVIALNDTVFSETTVAILGQTEAYTDQYKSKRVSNAAIAGIVIGSLTLLVMAAGLTYMQYRKRQKRAALAGNTRTSALSFRCQTHLTPQKGDFGLEQNDLGPYMVEKSYVHPGAALSSNPVGASTWHHAHHPADFDRCKAGLTALTTSLPRPPMAHSADDYATPISTTSTAPLIERGSPFASHGAVLHSSPGVGVASLRSIVGSLSRTHSAAASPQSASDSGSPWGTQYSSTGRDLSRKKNRRGTGVPVEAREIQLQFDPPPRRPLR